MGRCLECGELPLATVCDAVPGRTEVEIEFEVVAVDDGRRDFLLRLSRLIPEYNVVQLQRMEVVRKGDRVVPLGIRTNSIDLPFFMGRVEELCLTIELHPANKDSTQ